jgi:hypothetical protein
MQKSKLTPSNSDRQLIVSVPVPGRKYWKHPEVELYIDIEIMQERLLKTGIKMANKMVENVIKKVNNYLKNH